MTDYVCLVGLDEPEYADIRARLDVPVVAHEILPQIQVMDGRLFVENYGRPRFVPASKVVYHGIFEDDLDFITGLAFWGGPCLPNPRGMMDLRLKLPGLVRALEHTRFGHPRGYIGPGVTVYSDEERVAKWGNWHCGENKERFTDQYTAEFPSVVERFLPGQAVRIVIIGDQHWQIRLEGDDWLKSIHHGAAEMMPVDPDLLDDTQRIRAAFGLEIIANDYIVNDDGEKFLLEVNHIPNVTRFPQLRAAYIDFAVKWITQ